MVEMRLQTTRIEISDKRFDELRPLLRKWCEVLEEYSRRVPGDLPWWFLERPQVGFLAQAAWQDGWGILEEWSIKKNHEGDESSGRNDLWIGKKAAGCMSEWFIEAKCVHLDVSIEGKWELLLNNSITQAKRDAQRLKHDLDVNRRCVGAVFASPYWIGANDSLHSHAQRVADWHSFVPPVGAVAAVAAEFNSLPHGDNPAKHWFGSSLILVSAD